MRPKKPADPRRPDNAGSRTNAADRNFEVDLSRGRRPGNRRPLLTAGVVLGIGLGGFIDGIVLHQILQWHNMISSILPTTTLEAMETNMLWDGIFHAFVWIATAAGVALMWRAGAQADAVWSGKLLMGGLLMGWGAFNVVEGTIDHQILGLHHVNEHSPNWVAWDVGFLIFGALLFAGGWALSRLRRSA